MAERNRARVQTNEIESKREFSENFSGKIVILFHSFMFPVLCEVSCFLPPFLLSFLIVSVESSTRGLQRRRIVSIASRLATVPSTSTRFARMRRHRHPLLVILAHRDLCLQTVDVHRYLRSRRCPRSRRRPRSRRPRSRPSMEREARRRPNRPSRATRGAPLDPMCSPQGRRISSW